MVVIFNTSNLNALNYRRIENRYKRNWCQDTVFFDLSLLREE